MTKAVDKIAFNLNKKAIKAKLPEQMPCPYCNALMKKNSTCPFSLLSIDHIVPYSKGGTDEIENLIACCANCNSRKGNNNSLFFRIKETKSLNTTEYDFLNSLVTVEDRIEKIRILINLIESKDFPSAISCSQEYTNSSINKSFFKKTNEMLKEMSVKKTKDNFHEAHASLIIRLKAEKDKLFNINEAISHLNVSLYSLLPILS